MVCSSPFQKYVAQLLRADLWRPGRRDATDSRAVSGGEPGVSFRSPPKMITARGNSFAVCE